MRSWWKVWNCGWAHRQQTSLTQAYRNLFPDTWDDSILVVTTLRSTLGINVFFCIIFLIPLLVLLRAH
jgi:hypothetical protein